MSADCQDNMLNKVAVRASYILPILKRFLGENPRKPGGGLSPPGNNQNRNHLCHFKFCDRPFELTKFH